MLEFKLKHGSVLRKVIDASKDLVPYANFNCSSSCFSMNATDLTNLALVSFLLKSDTRNVDDDDHNNVCLGMNLMNLSNMLKFVRKDDSVTIMADRASDVVKLAFESSDRLNCADCEMRLMEIDCENFGIPECEYDVVVTMPSSAFLNTCRFLSNFGATIVKISVTDEGVRFSADCADQNVQLLHTHNTKKGDEATSIEMKKPVSLTFSLRHLMSFTKVTSLSSTVSINMSPDMPLMLDYKIEDIGYIRFHLVPQV